MNKTFKHKKMNSGGKFSYLYNKQQGNLVDVHKTLKKNKSHYSQDNPEFTSINIELISFFSEMVEIINITRLNKWSTASFS